MMTSVPNVLGSVRVRTKHEVADCQNLAAALLDPDGSGPLDNWSRIQTHILAAVILHVCYVGHDKTLRGVSEFFQASDESIGERMLLAARAKHDPDGRAGWLTAINGSPTLTHPMIEDLVAWFSTHSPAEQGGLLSGIRARLAPYVDRQVEFLPWADGPLTIVDLLDGGTPS